MPSRTSGAGVRRSIATKAPRSAAAAANEPSVRGETQPASGASTTREDEQQHPRRHGHRARDVERAPRARGRADRRGTSRIAGEQRDERDRDGQEEHPAPADLGQQPADHEPEREAGRAGRGVDRERLVARRALGEASW